MPELPEVEVVKKSLINKAQNSIVKSVKINDGRLRYKVDKNQIKKIIGLKLKKITRRSKFLLFYFNKKHKGSLYAFKLTIGKFISAFFKTISLGIFFPGYFLKLLRKSSNNF